MKNRALVVLVFFLAVALVAAGFALFESRPDGAPKNAEASSIDVELRFIDGVKFGTEPGMHREDFVLSIEPNDVALGRYYDGGEGGEVSIRYTTDGTLPGLGSKKYEEGKGIAIGQKTGTYSGGASVTVLRAAAFDAKTGEMIGRVASGSYIYAGSADRFQCAVISLITDPDNFFGYENGIYVEGKLYDEWLKKPEWERYILPDTNYYMRGIDWERPVHIEFFEPDGTPGFSQNAGIRIAGGLMRIAAQKSFKIFARSEYDPQKNNFVYDIFDGLRSKTGKPIDSFDSLMLRSASNNQAGAIIRTPLAMMLAGHAGFDTVQYRAAAVFLNGEYFGMTSVLEDNQDSGYYQHCYDIPKDEISMMNIRVSRSWEYAWELDNGPPDEYGNFMAMRDYIIENDMETPECYAEASKMLDMEHFAKYAAIQCYISNDDWPENNVRLWRRYTDGYNPEAAKYGYDGRWRFLLKDLDIAFGFGSDYNGNPYPKATGDDGMGLRIGPLFASVLKNEQFKAMYSNYMCDLANAYFSPEEALYVLSGVERQCENEMKYHIPRWVDKYDFLGSPGAPDSLETWVAHLEVIRRYIERRPEKIVTRTKRFLNLGDEVTLAVNRPEYARVKINTVELTGGRYEKYGGMSWTGTYFSRQGIPVAITCEPGWIIEKIEVAGGTLADTDTPGEKILTLTDNAVLSITTARDEKYEAPARSVVINEIFNAPDGGEDWIELYNAGDKTVSLGGWCLTDDEGKLPKWPIPKVSLEPGEFLVIYCTGKNRADISGELHTNFRLKRGEVIYLFDSNKMEIVDSREVADIKKRYSEGCFPDGDRDNWMVTARPTPGGKNK